MLDSVDSERNDERESISPSQETTSKSAESLFLPCYPFACWQMATVALFTSYLGAGSLIATNFFLMQHRVLAAMILLISALMSVLAALYLDVSSAWVAPLLSYLLARSLYRGEFAPFRRAFIALSQPPARIASLWYAFAVAIAAWLLLVVVLFLGALCLDLTNLLLAEYRVEDEV